MISSRVGERSQPELTNAPQPLDLPRLQQSGDDAVLLGLERNQTVNGVSENQATSQSAAPRFRVRRGVFVVPIWPGF